MSEQLRAALDRAVEQRGFSEHGADDPVRDFMATYFDHDDDVTRGMVVDFLERIVALAAAPSTPEPDADGFMMMHNAGRHDVACKWSRPGIIDASVDPCTCGLAEDIAAILASTPEPGIEHDCEWRRQVDDADETSAKLSQRLLRCQDELRAARLASKDQT